MPDKPELKYDGSYLKQLREYYEPPAPEQKPSTGEFLKDTAGQVGLAGTGAILRTFRGADQDVTSNTLTDELIQYTDTASENYLQKYNTPQSGLLRREIAKTAPSIGYSVGTMGAGLASGLVAGAPVGLAVASGVAFRATRVQKLDELYKVINDSFKKERGRPMSNEEWKQAVYVNDLNNEATKQGAYEALFELVGDALGLKILRGGAKVIGGIGGGGGGAITKTARLTPLQRVRSGFAKMGELQFTEQSTELPTNYMQSLSDYNIQQASGYDLGAKKPTVLGTLKDTASTVGLSTLLLGGGGMVASKGYDMATGQQVIPTNKGDLRINKIEQNLLKNIGKSIESGEITLDMASNMAETYKNSDTVGDGFRFSLNEMIKDYSSGKKKMPPWVNVDEKVYDKAVKEGFSREQAEEVAAKPVEKKRDMVYENTPLDQKKTPILMLDPQSIQLDPEVFQFKTEQQEPIEDVYDPARAGVILAYENENGERFVVEGHRRLELAKRDEVPQMPVQLLRFKDGVTEEQAKTLGGIANIKSGNADIYDTVNFIRNADNEAIKQLGSKPEIRKMKAFAQNASEPLYEAFINRTIQPEIALGIVRLYPKNIGKQNSSLEKLLIAQIPEVTPVAPIQEMPIQTTPEVIPEITIEPQVPPAEPIQPIDPSIPPISPNIAKQATSMGEGLLGAPKPQETTQETWLKSVPNMVDMANKETNVVEQNRMLASLALGLQEIGEKISTGATSKKILEVAKNRLEKIKKPSNVSGVIASQKLPDEKIDKVAKGLGVKPTIRQKKEPVAKTAVAPKPVVTPTLVAQEESKSLIDEAKKYDSVEEFIKAEYAPFLYELPIESQRGIYKRAIESGDVKDRYGVNITFEDFQSANGLGYRYNPKTLDVASYDVFGNDSTIIGGQLADIWNNAHEQKLQVQPKEKPVVAPKSPKAEKPVPVSSLNSYKFYAYKGTGAFAFWIEVDAKNEKDAEKLALRRIREHNSQNRLRGKNRLTTVKLSKEDITPVKATPVKEEPVKVEPKKAEKPVEAKKPAEPVPAKPQPLSRSSALSSGISEESHVSSVRSALIRGDSVPDSVLEEYRGNKTKEGELWADNELARRKNNTDPQADFMAVISLANKIPDRITPDQVSMVLSEAMNKFNQGKYNQFKGWLLRHNNDVRVKKAVEAFVADPKFARSPMSIQPSPVFTSPQIQRRADSAMSKWKGSPYKVSVIDNYFQVPEVWRRDGINWLNVESLLAGDTIYILRDRVANLDRIDELIFHEMLHAGLRVAFGKDINPLLKQVYEYFDKNDNVAVQDMAETYELNLANEEDRLTVSEELIAKLAENPDRNPSLWRRVVTFIKAWLYRNGITLGAKLNSDDIRAIIMTSHGMYRQGMTDSVSFARREQADTPEFKRWFKDSVVTVDGKAGSEPLVVYHGSKTPNIESFAGKDFKEWLDKDYLSSENTQAQGIYFSKDKTVSAEYGQVHGYYLKIENPFVGDIADFYTPLADEALKYFNESESTDYGSWEEAFKKNDDMVQKLEDLFGEIDQEMGRLSRAVVHLYDEFHAVEPSWRTYDLQQYGHDGQDDSAGSIDRQIIAFSPTQIKSATANIGTFDPNNPDIRYARSNDPRLMPKAGESADDTLARMKQAVKEERTKPESEQNKAIITAGQNIDNEGKEGFTTYAMNEMGNTAKAILNSLKPLSESKKDIWFIEQMTSSSETSLKKHPMSRVIYETAHQSPDDAANLFAEIDTDTDGQRILTKVDALAENNKESFDRVNRLINEADAWRVVFTPEELKNGISQERADKLAKMRYGFNSELSIRELQKGLTPEELEVWRAARTGSEHDLDLKVKAQQEKIDLKQQRHDNEFDSIAKEKLFEEIEEDKKNLKHLQSLRGSYFPHDREYGRYKIYARNPKTGITVMEMRSGRIEAEQLALELRGKGFVALDEKTAKIEGVELDKTTKDRMVFDLPQLPHNLLLDAGKTISAEAVINTAIDKIQTEINFNGYDKLEDVKSITVTKKDNEILISPVDRRYSHVFRKAGGQWYVKEKDSEEKVWHFKDITPEKEAKILFGINEAEYNRASSRNDALDREAAAISANIDIIYKSQSSASSSIHRADVTGLDVVQGYETDMRKAFSSHWMRTAHGIAKTKALTTMLDALRGTYGLNKEDFETYKEYREAIKARRLDPARQPRLYGWASKLIKDQMETSAQADRYLSIAKNILMIKYLGLKINSGGINTTALFTTVPANMSDVIGIPLHKTFGYILKASEKYADYVYRKHVLKDKNAKFRGLSGGAMKLMDDLYRLGWDMSQMNQESKIVAMSKWGRRWNNFTQFTMVFMKNTESFNRAVTILGSYMALEARVENGKLDLTQTEMEGYAKLVAENSHGSYDSVSKPYLALGKTPTSYVTKLFTTFAKFTHTQLMHSMAMMTGSLQHTTLRKNKHNFIGASYMLMSGSVIAGMSVAIPAKLAFMVIGKLFGRDDPEEDFYRTAQAYGGDWASEFARDGLFGLVGNVRLKGSLDIQLPNVPIGLFNDVKQGFEYLSQGETSRGIERLAPTVIGNIFRSVREYDEGVTKTTNAPLYYGTTQIQPTLFETTLRIGAGINVARTSQQREQIYKTRKLMSEYRDRRTEIYNAYTRYYNQRPQDRDPKELEKLRKQKNEFNERIERNGLGGVLSKMTSKSISRVLERRRKVPKEERARQQRISEEE